MSAGVKGRAWDVKRTNFDRNLAVVIGIDRYEKPSIQNLTTAVSDAKAIADLLEQKYAYKQSDEKPEVIRLFDKEATLETLRELFKTRIPKELEPGEGDRLIIYFAGHGLPRSNEDGPEGYLVPHDADPTKPELFLAMRDVYKALESLECHHLLMILDCCFAGTFRWAGSRKAVPILETIHREHYYHFIRHPAWQVITSSAHDQEALDVARLKEDNRQPDQWNKPHSPFALALLEGLQAGDDPQRVKADLFPDGVVTAHELFVYLQTRVKQLSGEQQAPGIYPLRRDYDKGEFIFTPPEFDPEIDLAKALPLNEENNPYRGLKSFDEKHARFFFGRQVLIEELAKRLAQSNQALTVVLGVSGSGKSSLVKAGLIPYLRNQNTEQKTEQWRILEPMRPGESPFMSLTRTLLPIANDNLLQRLAEVSFLDDIFKQMLKPQAGSDENWDKADSGEQEGNPQVTELSQQTDETLMKVANFWCGATPEAKLLLIEDYFAQLKELGNSQQRDQLKNLYDQILAELSAVVQEFQKEPKYLSHVIAAWSRKHPGVQLLLVIDQFEELLTRSQDDRESPNHTKQQEEVPLTEQKEWQKFLQVLRIAIENNPQTLRLVLTLRSDFEPRFLTSALKRYWKDARFPVRAMNSDELRQAIENPALKQAIYFEELKDDRGNTIGNLVSKLVDEVGQMPGALPLLSFTLSELYVSLYKQWQEDQSTDRTLRFADYDTLGGVAGALTRRATEEYDALDEKHQATMRRVMLRMVAIEGGGVARRRVPESELMYPDSEENGRVAQMLDCLIKARLLVKGQETGEPYVEPAHDFLIRGWDKLQDWIKEEQRNLVLQRELTPIAHQWSHSSQERRSSGLLWDDDPRLPLVKQISERNISWLNFLESAFIKRSIKQRRNKRNRAIGITTGVITSLFGLTSWALIESENSQIRALITSSEALLASNQQLEALLMATEAGRRLEQPLAAISAKADTRIRTATALQQALYGLRERIRLEGNVGNTNDVEFSPDGQMLASVSGDGTVRLWNLDGSQPKTLMGHTQPVHNISFSPDGQLLVTASDAESILWNRDGKRIKNFPSGYFGDARFSHDGKMIVVATDGKDKNGVAYSVVKILNRNGQEIRTFKGYDDQVRGFSFSSDDKVLAVASGKTVKLQNLLNGQLKTLGEHGNYVTSVIFSPDGQLLASSSEDSTVKIWNKKGILLKTLKDHRGSVWEVNFSSDSQTIASAGNDGTVKIWNRNGTLLETINPQIGAVKSVSFSPDNQEIAVSGWMKIKKINLASQGVKTFDRYNNDIRRIITERYGGVLNSISSISFSPDGKTIASASEDGTIKIWNLNGVLLNSLVYPERDATFARPKNIAFSSDGKTLAAAYGGCQGISAIWSNNGTLLGKIKENTEEIGSCSYRPNNFSFSPNGRIIASAITYANAKKDVQQLSKIRTVRLWNLDRTLLKSFEIGDSDITGIFFSPDSKNLAIANQNGVVKLWDLNGVILRTLPAHNGGASLVSFSPNSGLIASTGSDNTIKISDGNGNLLANVQEPSNAIAFSPDGQMLVSANENGSVKLWNKDGTLIKTLLGHKAGFSSLSFSPNGETLALGSNDGTIVLLNLDLDDLLSRSCSWLYSYLVNIPSFQNQRHLCDGIKPSPQLLIEQGQKLAQQGKIAAAATKLREALTLSPSLKFDPEMEARGFAVQYYVGQSDGFLSGFKVDQAAINLTQALELNPSLDLDPEAKLVQRRLARMQIEQVSNLLQEGKVEEAITALEKAQKRDPSLQEITDPETFNTFCWLGSIHRQAIRVMFACEKAVALAPEDINFRDSRGVARALIGNTAGAIEDFQAFIERTDNAKQRTQRQRWIAVLRSSKNPGVAEWEYELGRNWHISKVEIVQ